MEDGAGRKRKTSWGRDFAAHVLTTPQLKNLLVRFADVAAERPRDDGQSTDAQSMERIELSGPAAECQNPMYADSIAAAAAEHVQEFLLPVGTEAHSQEEIEQKDEGWCIFWLFDEKSPQSPDSDGHGQGVETYLNLRNAMQTARSKIVRLVLCCTSSCSSSTLENAKTWASVLQLDFPAAAIFAVKLDSLHICEQLSKLGTLWCGQCTFGGHNVSGFTLGVIDAERTSEPTLTVSTMDGEICRCSNGHVEGGSFLQQQPVLQPLLNFRTCVSWKD